MNKDIQLKTLIEEDIETVRIWRNSEEVSKYMYSDKNISPEAQKEWFKSIRNDTSKKYWIIEYEGKKLGLASLYNIDYQTLKSCYWAFYLGDTTVRGAGIGAKVEYNVLSYVFDKLELNKLRCEVFTSNIQVINMHEKFGFRREAYYREHCFKHGSFVDSVGLAMLKKEWDILKNYHEKRIYGS